jgi:hypothetical protein
LQAQQAVARVAEQAPASTAASLMLGTTTNRLLVGGRDRRIAGAVRELLQLEVGVEVQQRCFQRQSASRCTSL